MAWITTDDVTAALGSVSAADLPYLGSCTDAANAFAMRRRQQAGYAADDPAVAPSADAKLGTTLYAVALFRERGSVDSYSSFEEFQTGLPPQSSFGQVLRLLGVPRPAAA